MKSKLKTCNEKETDLGGGDRGGRGGGGGGGGGGEALEEVGGQSAVHLRRQRHHQHLVEDGGQSKVGPVERVRNRRAHHRVQVHQSVLQSIK